MNIKQHDVFQVLKECLKLELKSSWSGCPEEGDVASHHEIQLIWVDPDTTERKVISSITLDT